MFSEKERLEKQIRFIVEIDKAKTVFRQTVLMDGSRNENDAEHSWHLAVMAMLLLEYPKEQGLDELKIIRMALLHDLVEIDAGDTFCYDEVGAMDKEEREKKAAERIFNLLPVDQAREFRAVWEEFEARNTPESRFAAALDRLQPILHNYHTKGHSWIKHGIKKDQVLQRIKPIAESSETLWEYAKDIIEDAVHKGFLLE